MRVPYLGAALKGWTQKIPVNLITKTVVDFEVVETPFQILADINLQPMPAAQVNRKPEEQRLWRWWSIIIKMGPVLILPVVGDSPTYMPMPVLKQDDRIVTDTMTYKVQSFNDWTTSGFAKCEAIEDFLEST